MSFSLPAHTFPLADGIKRLIVALNQAIWLVVYNLQLINSIKMDESDFLCCVVYRIAVVWKMVYLIWV